MSNLKEGYLVKVRETGEIGYVERCDRMRNHYRVVVIIETRKRIFESHELDLIQKMPLE